MAGLGRRSHYRKHLTDSVLNDLPEPTKSNQRIAKVVGTRGSNQFELIVAPPIALSSISTAVEGNEEEKKDTNTAKNNQEEIQELDMTPQLSILPTKYRKLIWLKRNDFVICECAEEEYDNSNTNTNSSVNTNTIEGGIRFMITHILYKDQIKHLKEKNLWPTHPFFSKTNEGLLLDDEKKKKESEILIEKAKILMKEKEKMDHKDNKNNQNDRDDDEIYHDKDGYAYDEDGYDYTDDGIVFSNDNDYFVNTNRIAKLRIDDSSSDEDSD